MCAFAGAGARTSRAGHRTCRFREQFHTPSPAVYACRTPLYDTHRKTASLLPARLLTEPTFTRQPHPTFLAHTRIPDSTGHDSRLRVQRHLQLLKHLSELLVSQLQGRHCSFRQSD